MEHIDIKVKGKFTKYTELTAEQGYCFYDIDDAEEERQYMEYIATPITSEETLKSKYIVVEGSANKLNEEKEILEEIVDNNNE